MRARRSGRSCGSHEWLRRRVWWRWRTLGFSAARAAVASTSTSARPPARPAARAAKPGGSPTTPARAAPRMPPRRRRPSAAPPREHRSAPRARPRVAAGDRQAWQQSFSQRPDVPLAAEYPGSAMRRILLSCVLLGVLTLPAAAVARSSAPAKPGYLVVRKAAGDGGVNGRPVVTLVVRGFVLGRISQEARVAVYYLPSKNAGGVPQVQQGADVSTSTRRWNGLPGKVFRGSNFRFRAMGGFYRVVVRGSGVYLFAGGHGHVTFRGSSVNPGADGEY